MNTSSHHQSPDALELTDKLRFVVLTMPLLGVVGGFLRVLDVPSSISLGAIVPTFVALFVLTFFRRCSAASAPGSACCWRESDAGASPSQQPEPAG